MSLAKKPFNIPYAPVFRPTMEEWKDPMQYLEMIRAQVGHEYGLCKIIPPAEWSSLLSFKDKPFETRSQTLNLIEARSRLTRNFLARLYRFHRHVGSTHFVDSIPNWKGTDVDIWQLAEAVREAGGFHRVCKQKMWSEIGKTIGIVNQGSLTHVFSSFLKRHYEKLILAYDEFLEKTGYAPVTSRDIGARATQSDDSVMMDSEDGLDVNGKRKRTPLSSESSVSPSSSSPTSTAEDGDAKRMKVDEPINNFNDKRAKVIEKIKSDWESFDMEDLVGEAGWQTKMTRARYHSIAPSEERTMQDQKAPVTLPASSMKRGASKDAADRTLDSGACGSCTRPPDDQSQTSSLMTCSDCHQKYHLQCVRPELPKGMHPGKNSDEWYCVRCVLTSGRDFMYDSGKTYTLHTFEKQAHQFKANHFRKLGFGWKAPDDKDSTPLNRPFADEDVVESEYWRLVTDSYGSDVDVEYGADIHTSTFSSCFPTSSNMDEFKSSYYHRKLEKKRRDIYYEKFEAMAVSPWNLTQLPTARGSFLRYVKHMDISGVMVPWVYVGMCFSTFGWHTEDHFAPSINFLHVGETKTWYGIPGAYAKTFENAFRRYAPELFREQPNLLHQLVTTVSPKILAQHGVPVHRVDQRKGEFVVTFPRAYHAGFNHGFNVAEAVNYAPAPSAAPYLFPVEDVWLSYAHKAVEKYKRTNRAAVFSFEEILFLAMRKGEPYLKTFAEKLLKSEVERRRRCLAYFKSIDKNVLNETIASDIMWELPTKTCSKCQSFVYLSWLECACCVQGTCVGGNLWPSKSFDQHTERTDTRMQSRMMAGLNLKSSQGSSPNGAVNNRGTVLCLEHASDWRLLCDGGKSAVLFFRMDEYTFGMFMKDYRQRVGKRA